jgi:hypothetical protein
MKAKVIIENGETNIVLTPENSFEKGVLENLRDNQKGHNLLTTVEADYKYGQWQDHQIKINIKEIK